MQILEKCSHSSKDRFATECFGFDGSGMVRACVANKIFHTLTPPGAKAQRHQFTAFELRSCCCHLPDLDTALAQENCFLPGNVKHEHLKKKSHKIHDAIFSWQTLLIKILNEIPGNLGISITPSYFLGKDKAFFTVGRSCCA